MKKRVIYLALWVLCLIQIPILKSQTNCDLYLSTNFDSECLLTEYIKDSMYLMEGVNEDCILACKGNTVEYYANCTTGVQYFWTITGAVNYTLYNQGSKAIVTWGDGNMGHISVNVVTSDSNTCTAELCVLLMESPEVDCSTIPAYYIDPNGDKIIEICLGETIDFTDMSSTGTTPIVGYFWDSPYGSSSMQNYTITPTQIGDFKVVHKVQNECGCEDIETIFVRVTEPLKLDLSCYGTVCEGSTATYSIINPPCSHYLWHIEGGVITQGQNTPDITVEWGNPTSGYGTLSIDASFCNTPCNAFVSVKIPIISQNVEISGADTVCIGDISLYELPLWGSTNYFWSNSSFGGVNVISYEYPNQYMVQFLQAGIYELTSQYECDFLKCGPFHSATKKVVVQDTLNIHSDNNILCKGAVGMFTTNHSGNVSWKVLKQNGQSVFTGSSDTLYWSTNIHGEYRVIATHPNYCKAAEFAVSVKENPPALTTTDGPHEACPASSILLSAVTTHPNYYLSWEPVCSSASPDSLDGDNFTVYYGSEVCDVLVYQIDKEYGCKSDAFIHVVDTFKLAPHGLPAITTACAGSTVTLSVPDQSNNVTYKWEINPANAASVIDDHLSPTINILTNHLTGVATPYWVNVTLTRTYCSNLEIQETVQLIIEDVAVPSLTYPTQACLYDNVTFIATGDTSTSSHYVWHFGNFIYYGSTINKYFNTTGNHPFTLEYQPDPNCEAVVATGNIYISPRPFSSITPFSVGGIDSIAVPAQSDVTYAWEFNDIPIGGNSPTCPILGIGNYCCTVTSTLSPFCSSTDCYSNEPPQPDTCLTTLSLSTINSHCNESTIFATNGNGNMLSWSIFPSSIYSHCSPTFSLDSTTAHFGYPGTFTVQAYMVDSGQCYIGLQNVVIDCVPDIEIIYLCNDSILIIDRSMYRSGYTIPLRTVTIMGTGLSQNIVYPNNSVTISTQGLAAGIYNVQMTMANSDCSIITPVSIEPNPVISSINIPNFMCAQTPFLFSATVSGTIMEYHWDFGDSSYNFRNGIYHTYDVLYSNNYIVTLTVTNSHGCTATASRQVKVSANNLNGNLISYPNSNPICPGSPKIIRYYPYVPQSTYTWNPGNIINTSNQFNTYQTGDYRVLVVTNLHGCKLERMCNVGFLNEPIAEINGKTTYCFGEEVKLYGNNGSTNTYVWIISGPESHTFSTGNINFVPTIAGNYSAVLTVTNTDGCSASTTYQFSVHQLPPAPVISFFGNQCIHTPPVGVQSNYGQNLYWSNGYFGQTAYYYTDGYISAHYIEPTTGCPSDNSYLFIPPAPNFDALLTGCYEMCKQEFIYWLPVNNYYPLDNYAYWNWLRNGTNLLSGTSNIFHVPLNGYGNYQLQTTYGNNCVANSPILTIDQTPVCPCDSIEIKNYKLHCYFDKCQLFYKGSIQVCNYGSQPVSFDQFYTNSSNQIIAASPIPLVINPGGCAVLSFTMIYNNFPNTWVEFTLFDSHLNCEKTFRIEFPYEKCIKEGCKIDKVKFNFIPSLSTPHQTSYFDFRLYLPGNTTDLVAVWSEPSQVINYNYNPPIVVDGLLMLNYGTLSQMAANGEEICFHAIICVENAYLCHAEICIPAKDFLGKIPPSYQKSSLNHYTPQETAPEETPQIPENDKLYLAPNPAQNSVQVMGISPENISEILILDMNGKQLKKIQNNAQFDVGQLSNATYIVRVITTNKDVYYLKLVKQ